MKQATAYLYKFMEMVGNDPRISPAHISLYAAILYYYVMQQENNPVSICGRDLKKQAKILASATYYKCIRELKEYGYIGYLPSYNPVLESLVYLREYK